MWIHTKARFSKKEDEVLEELGISSEDSYEIQDFSFNTNSIFAYNKYNELLTCIRFDNYFESVLIEMSYDEIKELMGNTV